MKCSCSCTPLLALAGLAALGLGGFNMIKTGCPLGLCTSTTTTASVTPATHTHAAADGCADKSDCCAEGDKTADCSKCPMAQAEILKTAATDGTVLASDTAKTECTGKTECHEADAVAKTACEGKSQCPASRVADKGAPETPSQN